MSSCKRIRKLISLLSDGSAGRQAAVAAELWDRLAPNSRYREDASPARIAAAGAIQALVHILGCSHNDALLKDAASILAALTCPEASHRWSGGHYVFPAAQRAADILAVGGVAPLVQLMSSGSVSLQVGATLVLVNMTCRAHGGRGEAACAAVAAAPGAIALAVEHLDSSSAENAEHAAMLLTHLALDSASRQQALQKAGGIAACERCVHCSVQEHALALLAVMVNGSAKRCKAAVAAGGARACLHILERPRNSACKEGAADVLCSLALQRQARAVVAADPRNAAVKAGLEGRLDLRGSAAAQRNALRAALRALAAARKQAAQPAALAAPPLMPRMRSEQPATPCAAG